MFFFAISSSPPKGSIVQVGGIALQDTGLQVTNDNAVGPVLTPDEYAQRGFQYLVISCLYYSQFMAEPQRYPKQLASYQRLFQSATCLQQFSPSATRGGPTFIIFKLPTQ